jgi:hypothetical protein
MTLKKAQIIEEQKKSTKRSWIYDNFSSGTSCDLLNGACGIVVVKALCCKPEGRRFETQLNTSFFNLPNNSGSLGSGVQSANNRNECQKQRNKCF